MTAKEIKEKYFQLFILIMEEAGEANGVEEYKNVEKMFGDDTIIINAIRQKDIFDDDEIPFEIYILLLILRVVISLNGDNPDELEKIDNMGERVEDIFQRYLLRPTHKFTSKYGLPTVKTIWSEHLKFSLFKK